MSASRYSVLAIVLACTLLLSTLLIGIVYSTSLRDVVLSEITWMGTTISTNDENTLIIHDQQLAQAYYQEWLTLWSAIGVENLCNPATVYLPVILK